VKVYCTDGNSNTASTSTTSFTASIPGAVVTIPGVGGSSSTDDGCTFKVLQPAEGTDATDPFCPVGGTSKPFPVTILNLCTETREFTLEFPEGKCAVTEPLLLAGNTKDTILLEDCKCPIDKTKTEEFTVTVRQGEQTSSFKVRLSTNNWIAFLTSPTALLFFVGGLVAILIITIMLFLTRRLNKRRR
jgi:hypothetical protein